MISLDESIDGRSDSKKRLSKETPEAREARLLRMRLAHKARYDAKKEGNKAGVVDGKPVGKPIGASVLQILHRKW